MTATAERDPGTGSADRPRWTISIVSHGHGARVVQALTDLHRQLGPTPHAFVLTLNANESADFIETLPGALRQKLDVIRNTSPRGFAANHNNALRGRMSEFVLVADPDLALPRPVFDVLERHLADPGCGIVSPLAFTPTGMPDDNGRSMVTPGRLLRRYVHGRTADVPSPSAGTVEVDWLAGLFLAMRTETFQRLGGFDEAYYLYCEDVDLCLRARSHGLAVRLLCETGITHAANRDTLKKLNHLRWHVQSLLRLWRSPAYRRWRTAATPAS